MQNKSDFETKELINPVFQLQAFLDNLVDVLFITDLKGNITYISSSSTQIFGLRPSEMIGKNFTNFLHPDSIELALNEFKESILSQKKLCNLTLKMFSSHKSFFYGEINSSITVDELNQVCGTIGVIRDITEKIKSSRLLKQTVSRLETITKSAQDGIVIINPQGKISFWNNAASKIFGYTEQEALQKDCHQLLAQPDLQDKIRENFLHFSQTGEGKIIGKTTEMQTKHKLGHTIDIELSISSFNLEDQWHATAIIRDITSRKKIEEQGKKSEEKFFKAFQLSPDPMMITRLSDGKIIEINEGFKSLSNIEREEAIQHDTLSLQIWNNPKDREILIQTLRKGKKVKNHEYEFINRNKESVFCLISADLISVDNEDYIIATGKDITSRKLSEKFILEEHKLSLNLARAKNLQEILNFCSDSALNISSMESVAIYLFDQTEERLLLAHHTNLPESFTNNTSEYTKTSPNYQLIKSGKPVYDYLQLEDSISIKQLEQAGIKTIAIIPIIHQEIIGSLNLASKTLKTIPEHTRLSLETIAQRIGAGIKENQSRLISIEKEARYRTLFNTSSDALFLIDSEGKFLDVNQVAIDRYGYSKEEFLQMSPAELAAKDKTQGAMEKVIEALKHDSSFEWQHQTKTGKIIPVEIYTRKIELEGKKCTYAEARDISIRKQTEESLRSAAAVMQTIPSGVFIYDYLAESDSLILFDANPAALSYTKLNLDEIRGKEFNLLWPNAKSNGLTKSYLQVMRSSFPYFGNDIYYSDNRISGAYKMIVFKINNNKLGVAFEDITEKKVAEEALKASEEKFRTLAETAQDAIVNANHKTEIIYWNKSAERIFGWSKSEIIGQSLLVIIPQHVKNIHRSAISDTMIHNDTTHTNKIFEAEGVHKNGSLIPVELAISTWKTKSDKFLSIIIRDISDRKKTEREKLEMQRTLQQVQKLESLGVLAGGIAHDFNNILATILGYSELALMELSPLSPCINHLQNILKSVQKATDLCRQMLAYSGKGNYEIKIIQLNELIEEMLHLLQSSVSKKAILNINLFDHMPNIKGDINQITQIIMNLVINASESLEENSGNICINTGCQQLNAIELNLISLGEKLQPGLYAFFQVIDTGCGMSQDTLNHIFEPFYTTKFTGRGLGLSAVLGIIKAHQGAIKIESELCEGSNFTVYFPTSSEATVKTSSQQNKQWQGYGQILLVDDDPDIRNLTKAILKKMGFNTLLASNGHEAIKIYTQNKNNIRLVILDLTMPVMDGRETYEQLLKINQDIKVIIASGYSELELGNYPIFQSRKPHFIGKPYTNSGLKSKIKSVLDQ